MPWLPLLQPLCVEAYEVSLRNGTIRLCSSTSSLLQDGCVLKVLSEGLPYCPRDFVTSLVTISGLEASCVLASLHGILTLITNIDVDNRGLLYVLLWYLRQDSFYLSCFYIMFCVCCNISFCHLGCIFSCMEPLLHFWRVSLL
ncbi:hypothetical protein Bca101_033351 [Brassica carinata]